MDRKFNIDYLLKTTLNRAGEYSSTHKIQQLELQSVTNDLNEIFTDLFELHRYDGIIGIEILNIQEEVVENIFKELQELISL